MTGYVEPPRAGTEAETLIGSLERPTSPEKRKRRPPAFRLTWAAPRMWPAGWKRTVIPGAISTSVS